MPIATTTAILGSAVIAGGATLAAAKSNSKGIKQASQLQSDSNAQSVALQRDVYNQNSAALQPWQQSGLQANSILQGALGFGGTQGLPTQQPLQQMQQGQQGSPYGAKPWLEGPQGFSGDYPAQMGGYMPQGPQNAPQATVGGITNGQAANDAFKTFLDSINYNWQLEQGNNAFNGAWAGAGTLQSGAAEMARSDYNRNMAQSLAYQPWLSGVSDIANRGFGAASAQAGVGQNYANSVSGLNSANANAMAQLQIAKAGNNSSTIGGLGMIGANVLGNYGGHNVVGGGYVNPTTDYPLSGAYARQF